MRCTPHSLLLLLLPLLLPPATATHNPQPKPTPISPRCHAGLRALTARLRIAPPSFKHRRDLEPALNPATDPEVFPIPRTTNAGFLRARPPSPRTPQGQIVARPLLNPLEAFPNVLGPVRPDQIASVGDEPSDWCGYLSLNVLNGEHGRLFLDTTTYWVIFYVINTGSNCALKLTVRDLDQNTHLRLVPRPVPGQYVRIRQPGWHFLGPFQGWRGKEYILTLMGAGDAKVYWYIATQ